MLLNKLGALFNVDQTVLFVNVGFLDKVLKGLITEPRIMNIFITFKIGVNLSAEM